MALEGFEGTPAPGQRGEFPLRQRAAGQSEGSTPRYPAAASPSGSGEEIPSGLHGGLAAVRSTLGYDTASAFARTPSGWKLLDREGPVRPWHGVLDPTVLEGSGEAAQFADVRSIPGIGPRLAGLGCRALAVLPLPHGARLILDSATVKPRTRWIERGKPYLELIQLLSGSEWAAWGGPQHEATATLGQVFSACQETLAAASATFEALLDSVRRALDAHELFVVSECENHVEVLSSPGEEVRRLPAEVRHWLPATSGDGLDPESVHGLGILLGAASRSLAGGVGRDDGARELVLAGWSSPSPLDPVSMQIVARTVSTARAGLKARQQAVSTLLDHERARMAYALHDDVTQTVTGAVLELEALKRRIERDPQEAISVLENSKTEVRRALAELRAMLFDLSQSQERSEAVAPLTRYVEDVVKRWRLPARVTVDGDLSDVPARILSVAYSVIREALTNAAKHAAGSNVTVSLAAVGNELTVSVTDTGRGFTPQQERAARQHNHFGLDMLRRRVEDAGGIFDVDSRRGKGTRVSARFRVDGETR